MRCPAVVKPVHAHGMLPISRRCPTFSLHATKTTNTVSNTTVAREFEPPSSPIVPVIQTLLGIPFVFDLAASAARDKIKDRAGSVGVDFDAAVANLQAAQDWDAALDQVSNPNITYPDYYTKPFHAYKKGNLEWGAAFEVRPAAVSVHANVMDPAGKQLQPDGDEQLRGGYSRVLQELLSQLGVRDAIQNVVDLGCATGLSSLELLRALPGSSVTGVDLSPHFLAVAQYEQQQRMSAAPNTKEPLTFIHAAAEATGLPDASADLVSLCLVCHELPQQATRDIFQEAYRVLRPGGVLAMCDMNPSNAMFANPVAFAVFSSTEPHLKEYLSMDMAAGMEAAGFERPLFGNNTPRHRVLVAQKPAA